jgi:hypothetical protein
MSFPRKINLNYIDQVSYLQGFHRSGWPYVLRHLLTLQNDSGILCDTYVDRTFHWAKPAVIPYKVPWIGFIHHTFNTSFSDYNNVNLLRNADFLESLHTCKGIFVFTLKLRDRWRSEFAKLSFDIPVQALTHPTEFVSSKFTISSFLANEEKMLVQIGAWLRDSYAIYALNNGKGPLPLLEGPDGGEIGTIEKAALMGTKMENYFKPIDFFTHFTRPEWKKVELVPADLFGASTGAFSEQNKEIYRNFEEPDAIVSVNGEIPAYVLEYEESVDTDGMCRDIMCRESEYALNKYVIGAINLLRSYDNSVTVLPTASNEEYDDLLTRNIVFLNLVDAGAVNTLVECMVRDTPFMVNRHPAVVEIFKEGYPLYYDDISEVPKLLTVENITAAHEYLAAMTKDSARIGTFLNEFVSSGIYKGI